MTTSPAFREAVALILKHEGGYVNDPRDPGGETNHGISKRAYPAENIAALTVERAKELYYRDYWLPVRGDDLPPALALVTFDMAVNAGTGIAIKLLQRALGVTDDGLLGPVTLAKAKATNGLEVAVRVSRRRILYYAALPGWQHYAASWTQRTLETVAVAAQAFG